MWMIPGYRLAALHMFVVGVTMPEVMGQFSLQIIYFVALLSGVAWARDRRAMAVVVGTNRAVHVRFRGLSLDGRGQVVASFLPPVSAVVMPKRILAGGVEWWEPLLALGQLAACAAVTVRIGERLYCRALLRTGGRVSLRQAWAAAEQAGGGHLRTGRPATRSPSPRPRTGARAPAGRSP
jgi:hypothetical protein